MKEKKEQTSVSEHCENFTMVMSTKERRVAKINARDISILVLPKEKEALDYEETKAEGHKKGEAEYNCEEDVPDNPPCAEEQEPLEDGWFCPKCSESPC